MKKFSTLFLSILVFSLFLFVAGVSAEGARDDSTSTGQNQELRQVDDSDEAEKDEADELETDQNRERNELGEMKGESLKERAGVESNLDEVEKDDQKMGVASGSAKEHMGEVAKQVQVLLEMKEDAKGIGQKVKEIAKEQVKSQEKIALKLAKMEEKKIWLKKMFGYDREAVSSVQEEIAANRSRINELLQLQEETSDKTEIAELENTINALVEQNASLQGAVQEEMKNQGVWGWFRSFFNRS